MKKVSQIGVLTFQENEASKLSQDDSRRKIGTLEREVESLKALQGGGKVMSKAQRTFRERQTALGDGEGKENQLV